MEYTRPATRYPVNFDQWPHERRVNHLTVLHTREGLIRLALALAHHDASRDIDSRTRLRKDELAAVVLALDPDRQSPSHYNRWD